MTTGHASRGRLNPYPRAQGAAGQRGKPDLHLKDDLAAHNRAVAGALVDAGQAIDDRAALYTALETGLQTRFGQVKAAVAGQFGRRSAQYKTVSSIRL